MIGATLLVLPYVKACVGMLKCRSDPDSVKGRARKISPVVAADDRCRVQRDPVFMPTRTGCSSGTLLPSKPFWAPKLLESLFGRCRWFGLYLLQLAADFVRSSWRGIRPSVWRTIMDPLRIGLLVH